MFVVKQNKHGSGIKIIGYFETIRDIFDYFKIPYTDSHQMFSHRFEDYYKKLYKDFGYLPEYCYVIENEKGIRYSQETVKGLFDAFRKRYNGYQFWGFKRHPRGHYHRIPKTIQEKRYACNVLVEEGEPKWRPSRNNHNLPDSYSDIMHSDRTRNWKKYRKTQWK